MWLIVLFKVDNKETVVWKQCGRGGTQIDIMVTSGYPHQSPLWLHHNRSLTFTVDFRSLQRLEGASSFVTLG